jgi:hypothetical protein
VRDPLRNPALAVFVAVVCLSAPAAAPADERHAPVGHGTAQLVDAMPPSTAPSGARWLPSAARGAR